LLTSFDLFKYQDRSIEHVVEHARRQQSCACWIDTGLGKTVTGETAVQQLGTPPTLVAAPLRVARDVWPDETNQWLHLNHLKVVPIIGDERERLDRLRTKADIHTINRENLPWLRDQFLTQVGEYRWKQTARFPWEVVYLDEAQSFKSQSSARHRVIWQFRNFFKPVVVEFTGTPATKSYDDIWGQLRLIDGGERLGRSHEAFQKRWFDPPREGGYGWTLKPHSAKEIQALIADVVLSMRAEDYLELPPVTFNPVRVNLPPAAMFAYKKFERESLMTLNGKTITAVNAGVLRGKLLQAANGAIYTGAGREYEIFHEEKVTALLRLLETYPEPVMIGYAYKHDLQRIERALERYYGKKKLWGVLKSAASMKSFAGGLMSAGIIHPGSGGHGLNDLYLSGSENLIWFGLTDDLEMWLQLNARLTGGHRRTGRNITISSIVANGTADEDSMALLTMKDATQDDLTRSIADMRIAA
jgi:hypothetical protein